MELELGPEMRAFREEMRAWIGDHAPPGLADLADWSMVGMAGSQRSIRPQTYRDPAYRQWERELQDARLICPQWPEDVGGRGWDGVQVAIFNEECHRARVPRVRRGMGETLVGPSIIVHGNDEQRARLLPAIIEGRTVYCQGFSEPNHGSDLAGVECSGEIDEDELVITGQKVWTSGAHNANWFFALVKTEHAAPRHHNLSYVLMPLHENHIEIRPIHQISGASEFYETFLDGARAQLSDVIGGLGNGWRVAMTTLGFERGGSASVAHLAYEREFWELVETARRLGRDRDPLIRQQLAWAYSQVQIMRYSGLRTLAQMAMRREPGPEASINKLFWSEYHRRLGEIAVEIEGAGALVRPDGEGYLTDRWQDVFLSSRAGTIYSGTSEIQRNIVAERALGLPKEPSGAAGGQRAAGADGARVKERGTV
ncbi:MAG: acyl-CoA dehydrogenase family protein, partial [Candidatus Dormibacteraeota bacterium]|nr:acyl-CoA dehydrogenase family protein [Candidatus Dormibacteraeota bacterium]